jgi:hypothetical protein
MPHTNRKKKTPSTTDGKKPTVKLVHTKRQQIEDDEGWTHVVDTPRKTTLRPKEGQLHTGDFEENGVAYVTRTLDELRGDLEYYTRLWEGESACIVLRERFGNEGEVREGRKEVDSVICLGLGSLQSARREGRRTSFTQLAALRSIIQHLGMPSQRIIY